MNTNHFLPKLIALFILLKFVYLIFSVVSDKINFTDNKSTFSIESYKELSMRKDAHWYKKIAIDGYTKGIKQADGSRYLNFSSGQSEWAFFPFYPMINGILVKILNVEYKTVALATSLIFSILAIIGYFLFCENYFNSEHRAFWCTTITFVFPFHFYFSMFLTEGPFLACLVWTFYFISRNNLLFASIVLIPLVLLRPNGLILFLPIFIYYLEKNKILKFKSFFGIIGIKGIAIFIPAVLTFCVYIFYQYSLTGHLFAFKEAQNGWGKEMMFPLSALFKSGDFNCQATSWYVIGVIGFFIFNLKRFNLSFKILVIFSLMLPLMSGSTYSMIRYLSVAFPLFLVLSEIIYNSKFRLYVVLILFIVHLGSFYLWYVDHPLGF